MVERTEVEKYVRWLIASDIIYRPLKSLGEKGVRRLDSSAADITELLRDKKEVGSRVEAKIEEKPEEMKARTQNEGIDEFCKKYPQYGKILNGLIEEKRMGRCNYLVYRLKEGYKLSEEDYVKVIRDLGFDEREAAAIYSHILSYSERVGKAGESNERTILLKEQKKPKRKK